MKKKLNLLDQLMYAFTFVAAREAIVRKRYSIAIKETEKMFKIFKEEKPSNNVPIQANIMCGLSAWNMNDFELTFKSCRVAINQINENLMYKNSKLNDDELYYLLAYCKNLVAYAWVAGGKNFTYDFNDIKDLRYPNYQISRVSSFLARTFPVTDTDWWRD
jgi:hypothetical protein